MSLLISQPRSHEFKYGSQTIRFGLLQTARKDLRITVFPDLRVEVKAPDSKDLSDVLARVKRRAPWITRQLDRFERFHPLPTPREFVSGETHLYLGRQYRLKVTSSDKESVKLQGRYIRVTTKDKTKTGRVMAMLEAWYKERAAIVYHRRLKSISEITTRFRTVKYTWSILKMKKRWGSCTRKRRILLNPDLVKVPVHCIDYVLVHELCHILEPNHGAKFYRLLTNVLPDWKRRKARLEESVLI